MNLKNQLNLKIEIACGIIGNTHTHTPWPFKKNSNNEKKPFKVMQMSRLEKKSVLLKENKKLSWLQTSTL